MSRAAEVVVAAVLAALLLAMPAPVARAQDSIEILRDCADDDILQGDYSVSAMRKAIEEIPTDMGEYSPCRDVLSREIAAKIAALSPKADTSSRPSPPRGRSAASPTVTAAPSVAPRTGKDVGVRVGPSTPRDWQAIGTADAHGGEPVIVQGRPISPAASVGRNAIPGSLIAVLGLLAAAAAAAIVASLRRR